MFYDDMFNLFLGILFAVLEVSVFAYDSGLKR